MPEMDGAELLRRVRRLLPGLPALMVTGYVKDRASLDAVEVEVLRKPFALATLGARVRELLGLTPEAPHSRAGAALGRHGLAFRAATPFRGGTAPPGDALSYRVQFENHGPGARPIIAHPRARLVLRT